MQCPPHRLILLFLPSYLSLVLRIPFFRPLNVVCCRAIALLYIFLGYLSYRVLLAVIFIHCRFYLLALSTICTFGSCIIIYITERLSMT